ncbi:P-loop ATPase [Acinetobacter wanghuae]|uniref:P-loop ATPase n=1 Tax=Acinetobacter wanghuae TaxID=2662362 RepID=A0A5Q0P4S7_9GAMM|nr:P-loop NTPase fold protein [Acinetobacter wanghuae]MQW91687.1 P-loop ATPase [Acinetobacter wanghuae]QGA11592.1 P-loop ATPase [Acinetobacter wanghuae]
MTTNQLNWQKDNFENIETAWEGDLWDRRRLGEQLEKYVDRLQCGAVLALDARWGEGKTWFVRNWKRHLETTEIPHNVIYLDAFANDYLDDPFLVIASEIAAKLDKTADKHLVHKFKKAAAVMQQGLLTIAPTLIASMISCALTGGIIPFIKVDSESIKDKIDDAIDDVANNIGEKVTEAIQNKIDSYEEEKQSLHAFKNTLTELAASLDEPLVFIIDELDRCRPDFAIRLIERIKHFFDIPKIVFVLVMDKTQFSKVVCHNYGYDETFGEEYLDKFVDFTIKLKNTLNEPDYFEKATKDLFIKILGHKEEDLEKNNLYHECRAYIQETRFSKRELKNKINQFSLIKLNEHKKDSIILATLFFKDSDDLFKSIYHAIHNYTDLMIRIRHSVFTETWYETDRYTRSNLMLNIWNELFSTEYSIVHFIDHIKKKIDIKDSFISSPALMHRDEELLHLLKQYSLNTLHQSNQFDLKCRQYIESGFAY